MDGATGDVCGPNVGHTLGGSILRTKSELMPLSNDCGKIGTSPKSTVGSMLLPLLICASCAASGLIGTDPTSNDVSTSSC